MKISPKALSACLVLFLFGCAKNSENITPIAGKILPDSVKISASLATAALVKPTITNFTVPSKRLNESAFTLVKPTSNSTGAFTYKSSNVKIATINGQTLTITGVGTCVISAAQAVAGNFKADTIKATFIVKVAATQKPTVTGFAVPVKTFGDAAFALTTPKSNCIGAFTYITSNTKVATITGSTVTITGAGSCTISACQAAAGEFARDTVKATFTVKASATKPTITAFTIPTKRMGDPAFALTKPTSNSTGAFTYKTSNTAFATVSGTTVTLRGAGTCTITAYQAAAGTFKADSIKATFIIAPYLAPNITWATIPDKKTNNPSFTLATPVSSSKGAFTYTSSNVKIATVAGNVVTIHGPGQCVITATQAANGNYLQWSIKAPFSIYPPPVTGSVTDVDGIVYQTILINGKTWMAQNLRATHYQDGTAIPNVTVNTQWSTLTTGASADYSNNATTSRTYGKLYNWFAVNNTKKLAPKGWHVATDAEWAALYAYVGGTQQDGSDLQEAGTAHWQVALGTNSTLFTALAGGYRKADGTYDSFGFDGTFWTGTASTTSAAWSWDLYVKGYLSREAISKNTGYSVRCVKD
ncbi:MAG: hypothetical protein M3O71_29785 [Bacteroidota bacterium]|nr:hypothetical protein [Bacteroidota bacterium]